MCVILDINPGFEFPSDKLDLACDINKHGFGLSFPEKGKIVTIRDTKKNDAKEISDLLQKHRKHRVYLHLRHATKGEVIPENSHPFLGLNNTLGFMHNGTLSGWCPSNEKKLSDSHFFFHNLVLPLTLTYQKAKEKWIDSLTFRRILHEMCTGASVFLLFNGDGERLVVGGGKEYDGFWSSNSYSFDKTHYRSSNNKETNYSPFGTSTGGGLGSWESDLPGVRVPLINQPGRCGSPSDFFKDALTYYFQSTRDAEYDHKAFQCMCIGFWINSPTEKALQARQNPDRETLDKMIKNLKAPRKTFLELSEISDYTKLGCMTEEDFKEMSHDYPAAVAALIVDLLSERALFSKAFVEHTGKLDSIFSKMIDSKGA